MVANATPGNKMKVLAYLKPRKVGEEKKGE